MNEHEELKTKNKLFKGFEKISKTIVDIDPLEPLTKHEMVEIMYEELIRNKDID